MADYLLVLKPTTSVAAAECPEGPTSTKVERFGDPIERIEVQVAPAETPEQFDEIARGWLEIAERAGMTVFDPQIGRIVSRADLGEILDARARALAYALGVLGDAGVGLSTTEPPRAIPAWAWGVGAIVLLLLALRFCSSLAV